jgi:branched-chain amino acid transport system ATP-binding protein
VLEVDAIHTYYGESHVLHGVSLRVAPGEAVALLGRNGAGKTTAIRSIVGFTPPRAGHVRFEGQAIDRWPAYRIARRGLALVPQGRRIFAPLSVRENLTLGARAQGWTLERVFALFPRLRERESQAGGTLSGGEQQMLALARALMLRPRLLLLDEPSLGLAPLVVQEIFRIVRTINERDGVSVLLVEQNAALALALADHAYLLETGRVVLAGPADEIRRNDGVRRAYLGY